MNEWVRLIPAEIMVTSTTGSILEMNKAADELFKAEGGHQLLGKNVLDCHPEPAREKLTGMMLTHTPHAYYNTENGEKRFFFQSPWYQKGLYEGFVEVSFPVPDQIPHFLRG
jgi:transcriptional regulator with PAS, ATPase and Fis domain